MQLTSRNRTLENRHRLRIENTGDEIDETDETRETDETDDIDEIDEMTK